jgi:electron transfer flavoprotein alpha subunit
MAVPKVDKEKCEGCGDCVDACPTEAISLVNNKAQISADDCSECFACVDACPTQAIEESE